MKRLMQNMFIVFMTALIAFSGVVFAIADPTANQKKNCTESGEECFSEANSTEQVELPADEPLPVEIVASEVEPVIVAPEVQPELAPQVEEQSAPAPKPAKVYIHYSAPAPVTEPIIVEEETLVIPEESTTDPLVEITDETDEIEYLYSPFHSPIITDEGMLETVIVESTSTNLQLSDYGGSNLFISNLKANVITSQSEKGASNSEWTILYWTAFGVIVYLSSLWFVSKIVCKKLIGSQAFGDQKPPKA